jgi:hypothetical protein
VFENRVLRMFENRVLRVFENRVLRVFENRVLGRTSGPKRNEITRGWRKLHNVELHDLYSRHIIVRVIKSIKMRWAGHVARMGRRKAYAGFCWGNLSLGDQLGGQA